MTDQTTARNTCDASMSTLFGLLGPCVLRADHDGPAHQDAKGVRWGGEAAPADPAGQLIGSATSRTEIPENAPAGNLAARLDAAYREIDDLRTQVAAAQDALAAAHRAGYEQAIDNLRDRTRYLDWWSGPGAAGRGQTAHDHLADYLADTYEIPA